MRREKTILLAVLCVAAASWFYSHRGLGFALHSGDAHEYAEMARRLAAGEGFTTGVIFPAELFLGSTDEHPAVVRPPLWPLGIAGLFAAVGPRPGAVHAGVLLCFLAAAAVGTLLALHVGGPLAGAAAGLAIATSPQILTLALDGASETLAAFLAAFVFLLAARAAHPAWLGVVCGLAYLTRYNAVVLLPAALLLVALRRDPRGLLWCVGGFAVVGLPWWVRNALVAGDPFYSLLNWNLWMSPEAARVNGSLLFTVEPDLESELAMHPLRKLPRNLVTLLRHWELASANLAACVGVALACVRRERLALAGALVALGTTLGVALVLPLGRYFVPLLPVWLALGAAGWARHGGRLAWPALVLLVLGGFLPAVPDEAGDMKFFRAGVRASRGAGAPLPVTTPGAPCFEGRPVVLARAAARVAWEANAIAIYAPVFPDEWWRIADDHPVRYAQVPQPGRLGPRFATAFGARPDCGPDFYERAP